LFEIARGNEKNQMIKISVIIAIYLSDLCCLLIYLWYIQRAVAVLSYPVGHLPWSAFTGCASQNVSTSNWQLWRIDPSTAPLRPTYSHVSPAFPTLHPDDGCGLLTHIIWTFRWFVSLQSAGGRFRFRVPPSGTICLSTSHLRRHSRFSDNDSRPFCFPVPTKTLSYNSCVTITIRHYCLDTCGPCNNWLFRPR